MYRAPVFTANPIPSHSWYPLRLVLSLLNQQQVARMYNVFGRCCLQSVICFYRNNSISNVAEHYP
jgi:hypothetical protein